LPGFGAIAVFADTKNRPRNGVAELKDELREASARK
jgi:hypothetical protein